VNQAIIRQARQGDRDALGAIIEHYQPQIRRFVGSRLSDPHLVDDVVQMVWIEMLERIAQYEDRGYPISSWLYVIARSRLVDAYRRQSRHERRRMPIEDWAGADDGGIERALVASDVATQAGDVLAALRLLPARQRKVIELRFLQDVSIVDIARQLGVSPGAVKALQSRGLAGIQRRLRALDTAE
jgi:RNA polymerase sigma-70 factor, ECF subfamily